MPNPWTLAIDFGTTYTAAAATVRGSAEAIEIDGDRRVPSIIFVAEYSKLIAGKAAENQAAAYPERALRELKRMVGEPTPVVLAGRPFAVVDLVAALLQHVHERAVEFAGSPPAEVRLTHPATWRRPRIDALRDAAARAGIGDVSFISEPVAAAIAYATEIGDLGHDGFVGIYDLGGGTFDTAVLRSTPEGFAVHGRPSGDGRIGGELFDELLAQQVGAQLDPAAWEELMSSDDAAWRQARVAFRTEVRKAKEALSLQDHASLVIPLPAGMQQLAVDRASYETLIAPYVAETIEQFVATVTDAGVEPSQLRAVYLVGGASRTPMIERELSAALPDVAISKRGDPKMAVALGATMGSLPSTAAGSAPTEPAAASTAAVASTVVSRVGETEPSLVTSGSGGSSIEDAPGTGGDPQEPGRRHGSRRRRAVLAALGAGGLIAVAAAAFAFTGPFDSDTAGLDPTSRASASDDGSRSPTPSPRPTDRRSSSPSPSPSGTPTASPSGTEDPEVAGGFLEPGGSTEGGFTPGTGSTDGGGSSGGGGTGGGGTTTTPAPTPAPTVAPTPAPAPSYVQAAIVSPTPGSTFAGSSVTFSWGAATNVRYYSLWVGSQPPPDPNDAFAHYDLGASSGMPPAQTSVTITGLPTDGRQVYVRLFTKFEPESGPLKWRDYVFKAAGG